MNRLSQYVLAVVVSTCFVASSVADESAAEVFGRRILPIAESPNSSSCVQCHLSSVELKDYILPTHEMTFRSLRDQGLLDLDRPSESKIVKLINMSDDAKTQATPEFDKKRQAESDAFIAWIEACSKDPTLRNLPKLAVAEQAKPAVADTIIRHNRKDRLSRAFEKTIWSARFRCVSCHQAGRKGAERHRKKFGDRVIWVKETPKATMDYLIDETVLLDEKHPEKSLLLTKPLNEVKHQGGQKFRYGDQGYASFRGWLEDYANVVAGKYQREEDLPSDDGQAVFASQVWLRFVKTPEKWGGKMLEIRLFAWDREDKTWEKEPLAITDNQVVAPRRIWHSNLVLRAPRGSTRTRRWQTEPALPPGRYLVRVYLDRKNRRKSDWDAILTEEDAVGQVEFFSRWPVGFGKATVLPASRIAR